MLFTSQAAFDPIGTSAMPSQVSRLVESSWRWEAEVTLDNVFTLTPIRHAPVPLVEVLGRTCVTHEPSVAPQGAVMRPTTAKGTPR
jgi:hypothetical protein